MYETVNDLPAEIRKDCTAQEQAEYLRVFNMVYSQTNDAAKAATAAWGAVTKMRMVGVRSFRTAPNGDPIIGGWAMKFSDVSDKDAYNTYFHNASKLLLNYYPKAPLWMEHGFDPRYGEDPIGQRHNAEIYGFGVWLDHTLHSNHPLIEETMQGVNNGEFSYSSDSIKQYVTMTGRDRRMDSWPLAGCALTKVPAEKSLGAVIPVVSFRAFYSHLEHDQQTDPEAREAQRRGKRFFIVSPMRGAGTMDPQKLADLAAALGVEATPAAVMAALQELIAQLQGMAEQPAAEDAAMMSQLAPALGLPATAARSEIVGQLEAIKKMLTAPPARSLNIDAMRRFTQRVQQEADDTPEPDPIPYRVRRDPDEDEDDDSEEVPARRSARKGFSFNRGAQKPGILDVIGGITQIQGGAITFEMPAFRSQRTSPERALRSMNINNAPSGGWTLNREMSSEILEALYAKLVFEQLGAKVVPMDGIESITMNRVESGAVAYWAGANQTVTDKNAKLRAAVTLNTKELVAKSIIENKLLKNSGPQTQSMVEEDILRVMKLRMELSGLYGTGSVPVASGNSGAEPLGIYNITGITKTALSSANPTLDALSDMEGRIEDTNYDYEDGALKWLMPMRARRYFKKMKDTKGYPLFSEDWVTNNVKKLIVNDHPVFTTSQVPLTTNGSVVTTDIFLGDWSAFLIGQGMDLEMVVDTSRYVEERSTLIQVVSYVDYGVAYKEAFQVLTEAKV